MVDDGFDETAGKLAIEVVLALPRVQYQLALTVPSGTRAREAVRLALDMGLLPAGAVVDIDAAAAPLGVFAERVEDDYELCAGDRLEIYRPLQQDPKELRRQRAKQRDS